MNTKIYRVIFSSIDIDEADNTVRVTTFFDKDLARKYLKDRIMELKEQNEELDLDYKEQETEDFYERYLDGRSIENSISLWLEEDNVYTELELAEEKLKDEEEDEYEMQ